MAPNAYQKFSVHATLHLRASRHTWTSAERRNTILTIYHGDPTVRQHYSTSNTEISTLLNLFPDVAYTTANVVEARSHHTLPGVLASVQIPPAPLTRHARPVQPGQPTEPAHPIQPARSTRSATAARSAQSPQPTQTTPAVQAPAVVGSIASTHTGTPYEFWPPLPWPYEPDLPDVGAGVMSLQNKSIFMNTMPHQLDEETSWHGAKFIGSGSSGAAGLWCKVDEQGNVIDRMVVKDNVAFLRDGWRDPKNWRDRLPREIAIHRRLESRRSAETEACRHIVKYRGHRLLMSRRRFRLYTDYASGGDLQVAMTKSFHDKSSGVQPKDASTQEFIPEAFIWHTIKALASACLIMQHGTASDEPAEDWRPIVHLDLQLPNILLNIQNKKRKRSADETDNSSVAGPSKRLKSIEQAAAEGTRTGTGGHDTSQTSPEDAQIEDKEIVPMLTDFGLSTFDLDFDHCPGLNENPLDHILPHSHYNTRYSPEHQYQNPEDIQSLDEKTDVWGIGRIAWALIVNQWDPFGPMREGGPEDPITGSPLLPLSRRVSYNMGINDFYDQEVLIGSREWPAVNLYSEPLKALVRDCLRFWKDYRPTPREVLDRVNNHLLANPQLVDGMDVVGTGLVLPDDNGFQVGGEVLVAAGPTP
ncbi:hypothetical protein EKO04_009107 [Ascochyta lentis]|uniref:non-specific serine/threonine protein kinase n=1 Tax=Ascochyta lentis TaxID=205686 RepID=A0A8H7IZG0_9PLEO|nr:hypothetical protein EKO04_009107 [Ascochyta lentis]